MLYKELEEKRGKVRRFIKANPKTTAREIKKRLGIKVEKAYLEGMREAFENANIKSLRNFKRKTRDERRKIIIDFIKKHPKTGGHTISKKTKINVCNAFKNIQEAYKFAGVKYPRKKSYEKTSEEKRKKIIQLIKNNPEMTSSEITKKAGAFPYRLFKDLSEAYDLAGIKWISGPKKRSLRIKNKIISFVKENPGATQREINNACNTHVQEIFNKGIFEAYNLAGVKFPFERLKLYGIGLREIRERANKFEEEIALKLTGFGGVNRLVRSKNGIADIVFERRGKKAIIEVKDYLAKPISRAQINQLNKYLEDFNCNLGFLICHHKPKKNKFLIGKNKIIILEDSELKKVAGFMGL
ncbi:hypothetical protein HOA55_03725 [archaeon]|jgi:hypothetical protein|nr:hypothetical protein [archaeon]MBT3577318.1 hypothetical protein [archaeon]MBT6820438.1 hypothetical protein [archaeon]MBT6956263.1 hypothetical protein [archaeon]MBT7025252.1 hypothetical protein [archaeon]